MRTQQGAEPLRRILILTVLCVLPALFDARASSRPGGATALAAQATFEQTSRDLASPDARVRLRAVQLLKSAAYPEAAVPLAKLVTDPDDAVQLEAIAAELNIFLAERIVPRKRVGLVLEVRNKISADEAFAGGPTVVGLRPVPSEVVTALRAAIRDDNPRVGLEALYAFGTLAPAINGSARRELLRASSPDLAALLGAADPAFRFAALRVIGRLFEVRPGDAATEDSVGDAVIAALNDHDRTIKAAAMQALGAMRYERAVEALTRLHQYFGKGDLSEAALDALAHIAHSSSAGLFTSSLASRSLTVRVIAIEGLARLGDLSKLADIRTAVGATANREVQLATQFATVKLSGEPLDQLAEALMQPKLHDQAREYLIEVAPGHAQEFSRYAQDPDAHLRAEVADILGLGADVGALPILEPMMRDRDQQVALAAQRAVARLHGARATS
jgi:HEAT repeat protein